CLTRWRAMRWTALPRSCYEYHPEEACLSHDVGHDARQHSAPYGELRRRRQTVRPPAPQSGLQPDLSDLAALLRKTVFLHETNKRHVPFLAHQSGHKPVSIRLENAFELSQKAPRSIASTTQAEVEHRTSSGATVLP